jgi:hypothetical protein
VILAKQPWVLRLRKGEVKKKPEVGDTPASDDSLSLLCGFFCPVPFTVTLIGSPFRIMNNNLYNNDYHLY